MHLQPKKGFYFMIHICDFVTFLRETSLVLTAVLYASGLF